MREMQGQRYGTRRRQAGYLLCRLVFDTPTFVPLLSVVFLLLLTWLWWVCTAATASRLHRGTRVPAGTRTVRPGGRRMPLLAGAAPYTP